MLSAIGTASSAAVVSGTSMFTVNDGTVIDGTRDDAKSLFSKEFASSRDTTTYNGMTYSFGSILLSDVFATNNQFQFLFDSQETGARGNSPINIDDIVLAVNGVEIWNYSGDSLMLDGTTASPLGNGSDMGLYVNVSLFSGKGLTGADTLDFYWIQSDDDNGADEWVIVGDGSFGLDDPIGGNPPAPIPLPAGIVLLGGALGALGLARRRQS